VLSDFTVVAALLADIEKAASVFWFDDLSLQLYVN
jgi:hypothetical protein